MAFGMNNKHRQFIVSILRPFRLFALAYAALCLAYFLFQEKILYFPSQEDFRPHENGVDALQPVFLSSDGGLSIKSWLAPAAAPHGLTIVYMQGNSGYVRARLNKIKPWLAAGYGVAYVGYHGYGPNPGSIREQSLYADARHVIEELRRRGIPYEKLVLYGESLGSGIATQMATEYPTAAVILESPYTSWLDFAALNISYLPTRTLTRNRFETIHKINRILSPLLLVHSYDDEVIPFAWGEAVFAAAPKPKQAVFVRGYTHAGVYAGAETAVFKFLTQVNATQKKSRLP